MTKDQYFEMCDMLGSTPIESEIPIEYEDLSLEIQEALVVYNSLQDMLDNFNGRYLGKNLVGIKDIFDIMDVEDTKTCFFIINMIDRHRSKIINDKKPAK